MPSRRMEADNPGAFSYSSSFVLEFYESKSSQPFLLVHLHRIQLALTIRLMSVATTNGADEDTPKRKRIRTRKTKPRTRDISTDKDDISLQNGDEIVKDEDGRADATNDGVSVGQKSVSKEDKEGKSKRKRKRTRNKGGKEDQDLEATGQTEAASTKNDQEFISGLKSLVLSHGDHALDERTSNGELGPVRHICHN